MIDLGELERIAEESKARANETPLERNLRALVEIHEKKLEKLEKSLIPQTVTQQTKIEQCIEEFLAPYQNILSNITKLK